MLRIGELAKRADCLVQTVRFYEAKVSCLSPRVAKATSGSMTTAIWSGCGSSEGAVPGT